MSRNGSRWYVFGREVPLADGKIVAVPAGTVYVFEGWSRTEEAAIARRDKLDRAGRQGIKVFSPTRQKAMADVAEVYGVKVRGYMDKAEKKLGQEVVKAAVMREIFCPFSGVILDMRRAVVVETGSRSFVMAASVWDERGPMVLKVQAKAGRATKVYDGRVLFKR